MRHLHNAFRVFYVSYTLMWLACLYRLLTTGYYNVNGLSAIFMVDILFLIMKIQLFVIFAQVSLDLKLKTQVLGSGRVLLLAYDEHNHEVLKVVMLTCHD